MAAKNPSMYGSSSSRSVVVNVEATSSNTEHLFGPWMLVDTRRRRASLNKATPRVVECAKVWKDNSIGSRFLTLEVTTKIVLDTVNDEVGMTDTNVPSVVVLDIVTPSKMITVESLHIKEVDVVVIESNHRGQHTDILISDKTPQKTCSTSGKMAKLRVVSLEIPLLLPVDVLSKSSDRDKDVVPIVDGSCTVVEHNSVVFDGLSENFVSIIERSRRDGNALADWLAKLAPRNEFRTQFYDVAPL
ncbi:hypothetical protein V6N11_017517 [Hibiscus sabdariffa]|uniref:Uncharacterized protein n=1 Tax=Hibiscus sabdariffa TaxID=183260 RepID=A0ABR2TZ22_9ROSI